MPQIRFDIISIGTLSRNRIWSETEAVRTAHATTSLIRSGGRRILVDPGLPASVLGARLVDSASPIAYGYSDKVAVYCDNGPIFSLSSIAGERRRRHLGNQSKARPTGRGTVDDPDFAVGRVGVEAPEEPNAELWESPEVTDEQKMNNIRVIPPANRPRVILRYADNKELLISGLLEGGDEIAQHPAVLDVPSGNGHVILFSINPVYRGETRGTYSLVLNTILNFDNLNAGRKVEENKTPRP